MIVEGTKYSTTGAVMALRQNGYGERFFVAIDRIDSGATVCFLEVKADERETTTRDRVAGFIRNLENTEHVSDTSPLTSRQAQALRIIGKHTKATGTVPTYPVIATALGVNSMSTIIGHLQTLAKKGYLTARGHNAKQGYQITPAGLSWLAQFPEG